MSVRPAGRPSHSGTVSQENSAKLTNQRVSCAFTHIARLVSRSVVFCLLRSASIVILVFYLFSTTSVNSTREHCQCEYSSLVWRFHFAEPQWITHNIYITSTVPGLHFFRWQYMRSSANFRTVFCESQNANPLDAEPETHFNAKWPFKVIQGHLFRCQWRASKGLHSTI